MAVTVYRGVTLVGQALQMDECVFTDCVLKDCDLFYSGGDYVWSNTQMPGSRWHFRGRALKTIELGRHLGMMKEGNPASPPTPTSTSMMN
jgi:hypothetical protein